MRLKLRVRRTCSGYLADCYVVLTAEDNALSQDVKQPSYILFFFFFVITRCPASYISISISQHPIIKFHSSTFFLTSYMSIRIKKCILFRIKKKEKEMYQKEWNLTKLFTLIVSNSKPAFLTLSLDNHSLIFPMHANPMENNWTIILTFGKLKTYKTCTYTGF